MASITKRAVVKYVMLPGLKPRFAELFTQGFHYIPFFMALVYQAVRLLPANHPYTNPANVGLFGIRHVVAEAANNLVMDRKNIDQIVLFFTLLIGVGIVLAQIVILVLSLIVQPAAAAMPTSFAGFFITASPAQDLAYIFMDLVFGVPGMFQSCVATGGGCLDAAGEPIVIPGGGWILAPLGWPFPIHNALHQMFRIYNIGLMVVGALLTLYFIAVVIAETAQTGTAFGKRFNKVWAPIRLVVAFGLLMPLGYGLSSAQYIVLYAAKFGSGFATNGWMLFNSTLVGTVLGDPQNLISQTNVPEVGGLLQFLYVARTCAELEQINAGLSPSDPPLIEPFLVRDPQSSPNNMVFRLSGPPSYDAIGDYQAMIDFLDGAKQAVIVFGTHDPLRFPTALGNVGPICGEITVMLTDPRDPSNAANPPEPGPYLMQRYYLYIITELWYGIYQGIWTWPGYAAYEVNFPYNIAVLNTQWEQDPFAPEPPAAYKQVLQDIYRQDLEAVMINPSLTNIDLYICGGTCDGAVVQQANFSGWVDPVLASKGWAGAGIWYNKIAQLNGSVTSSILNIPVPSRYPMIMELVLERKKQQDQNIKGSERFKPTLADGKDVPFAGPADGQMAYAMWEAFDYWQQGGLTTTAHTAKEANPFVDMINAIFGTEGLYSMRRNENTHPLAQLVGVGRSLVEASIRNIGFAAMGGVSGVLASYLGDGTLGRWASIAASFAGSVGIIALTMGFVLFYVIPFMPFIYFFFAVGGWVKGIFEAMVGVPLWALAHIRIDGNGLPGQAAVNGYFMILEIFLRPILVIFGLLASISIFSALVSVLNVVWELVTANLSGFDVRAEVTGIGPSLIELLRSPIDEFFFTCVYTIIVYMMALSSFKLIDQIPGNLMRWMGVSIQAFNDQKSLSAEGLVGTTAIGGQQAFGALGGGLESIAKAGAQTGKNAK